MHSMRCLPICLLLVLSGGFARADADIAPFEASSMRAIEERHAGRAFLVAVWASDCPPCRPELEMIAEYASRYPDFPFVLVATDPVENRDLVLEILADYGLQARDTWIFADPNAERLRFAIDPEWFGEVPRSYYYAADGTRRAISGPVEEKRLESWFAGTAVTVPGRVDDQED